MQYYKPILLPVITDKRGRRKPHFLWVETDCALRKGCGGYGHLGTSIQCGPSKNNTLFDSLLVLTFEVGAPLVGAGGERGVQGPAVNMRRALRAT